MTTPNPHPNHNPNTDRTTNPHPNTGHTTSTSTSHSPHPGTGTGHTTGPTTGAATGTRTVSAPRPDKPVALVTGASGGLGTALATELDRIGCRVALHYHHNHHDALQTSEHLTNDNLIVQADITDHDSVTNLHHHITQELGEIDILINNAAIRKDALLIHQPPETWTQIIQTNLIGTYHMTHTVLPSMLKRRWGRIINIVSPSALIATPGQTAYATSKAAIIGLTRTLATETGRRGVTINALSPGFMETRMTATATQKFRHNLTTNLPIPRLTTPQETAPAIHIFLDNDYITGQTLNIDGGITLT
ncbi:3-oxoacyl-ACP reductase family protein [Streptomyces sp. NPDC059477]|uniref:3-oxoacyl-ACP reductase family protein n=1 Tax=Streptomyces sp. NPDC059477 TaxID=3346847 RepID=UPI003678DCA1